eukprot:TRINITY_DN10129_c0_g2_i1.p1 TRINITY_DN10129_c0_g2~~TRINITY_DN10129_c0_g2_i1.p1  ORF type:complete len:718 (+),score=182.33 TRINITY_DN10129_c0_g2_i1:929-3082(+)
MSKDSRIVTEFLIPTAEKRRDANNRNKHYVYEVVVQYDDGTTERIWRRYSQFDALRDTLSKLLKTSDALPKLTKKLYLQRSSVHEVAINRQPKLTLFLRELLPLQTDATIAATLRFFLTATAADKSRAAMPPSDGLIEFDLTQASPSLPSEPAGTGVGTSSSTARVLYAYEAQEDDEITVDVGDIIEILAEFDDGWAQVSKDESVGLLGVNYYEKTEDAIIPPSPAASLGSSVASSPLPPAPAKTAPLAKPTNPLEELIYTEHEYVSTLNEVKDGFFPRLRSLVTAPEAKTFFNNFAELVPAHESLFNELDACKQDLTKLDTALGQHLRFFKDIYARYCAGLPQAQELYETKLADRQFRSFEASFPDLNKPTLNYIMRPFQRVLKYPLLLKELSKSQGQSFPSATAAAEELAITANENMNAGQSQVSKLDISAPDASSFQRLVSIQSTSSLTDAPLETESSSDPQPAAAPPKPARPPPPGAGSAASRPPPPSSRPPPPSSKAPPPSHKALRRESSDEPPSSPADSSGFVMPKLKPVAKAEPAAAPSAFTAAREALKPPGTTTTTITTTKPSNGTTSSGSEQGSSPASLFLNATASSSSKPSLPTKPSAAKLTAGKAGLPNKPSLPTKPTFLKPVLAKKPPPPVKPDFTLRNARAGLKSANKTETDSSKPLSDQAAISSATGKVAALKATFGGSSGPTKPAGQSGKLAALQAKFENKA